MTPQERHAAEMVAREVLRSWTDPQDIVGLSAALNEAIIRAVRAVRDRKDCA
jgi:hypothetical protein